MTRNRIDPESPHRVGIDTEGVVRRLGETDSDGEFVGYIDETRAVWNSRRERDAAVGGGRCFDAFLAWNEHGGALWEKPDYYLILYRTNVKPEHVRHALAEFERQIWLLAQDTDNRAVQSAMN